VEKVLSTKVLVYGSTVGGIAAALAAARAGSDVILIERGDHFGGAVLDPRRIAYLHDHMAAAGEAIAAGVPLHGYCVWTRQFRVAAWLRQALRPYLRELRHPGAHTEG